jgi:hypothetical protein
VGIRNQLQDERRKRQMDEYLATVRDRTPVWTIFDDEPASGSTQAGAPAGTQTASQPRMKR